MSVEGLPADQRAVVQLILTQGRSYADLAGLMQSTPEAIRERAHAALTTLAGGRELPDDVADYLLGQQDEAAEAATRERIAREPETHRAVVQLVRLLSGTFRGSMPQIPLLVAPPAAAVTASAAEPEPDAIVVRPDAAGARAAAGEPRTSLVGGAILIAVVLALIAGVVIWAANRGDDDSGGAAAEATATASPGGTGPTGTADPDAAIPLARLVLNSQLGGDAAAEMIIYVQASQPESVFFQLAGRGLPPNEGGSAYAVWLTGGGPDRLLGFAPRVAENGVLGVRGPGEGTDPTRLPGWLDRAQRVVVTRESAERPTSPGEVVLSGRLEDLEDLTGQAGGAAPQATATP